MAIKALSTDTRQLIESTSLIASPVCLVRELVDNAIDVRASCVDIFISRNTVDKVEVRDNGDGIASADFGALGRQSHSSKREASGTGASGPPSLGFRGQGLASVNSLGYVTITTRTHDDAVASTFRLVPNIGGVASGSQKVASARVGTTVNVTCVFSALPVRRKVAVQESTKTIARIKTLLRGYALARPSLRLSFKILQPLGGASPTEAKLTAPWDYRPTTVGIGSHASMRQAVSALFGAEVARQCQETVASSRELMAGQSTITQTLSQTVPERMNSDAELSDFVFEAWLPQPGADIAKLKLGSFISVDGRPISADRYGSTGMKLTTLFTTAFEKSQTALQQQQHEGHGSPPQPLPQSKLHGLFIRLNIKCPPGSYDANVDTSKADVLFTDERFLCDAFERLCKRVYGSPPGSLVYTQPSGGGSLIPRTQHRTQEATAASFSTPAASMNEPFQKTHAARSALCVPPRQPAGRTVSDTPTPATRLHAQGSESCDAPVLIQISPRGRNRRRLISAPRTRAVRSLRTPPESPVAGSRGRINWMRENHSPEYPDLPGLVSCDGLRQTTISFNGPPANNNNRQRQGTNRPEQEEPTVFGTARETGGTDADSRLPTFVSARELRVTEPQVHTGASRSDAQSQSRSSLVQDNVRPHGLSSPAAQSKTYSGQSTHPLIELTSTTGRPTQIIKVDIQSLRRSAEQFARNLRAWEKASKEGAEENEQGGDRLSPEMADIASIESRLRAAVAAWATKKRSEISDTGSSNMGEGPVQVELYLRKSLKQKALMVRKARGE